MIREPIKQYPLRSDAMAQPAGAAKALAEQPGEECLRGHTAYELHLEKQNEELCRTLAVTERSCDRYASLYDFSPAGYLTLGLDGAIDEINLTCAALLGAERDKLLDCSFSGFVADVDKNRWQQMFPGDLYQDGHHGCEITLRRSDGSLFHARLECRGMSSLDGFRQVRVVLTDVSEHKNLEKKTHERRKEMDELQKLHVAAQTASAIAHELNQPLLAIASYSKAALLMMKSEKPDFDEICSAIEGSERQAHRAGQSIRELLDFVNSNEFLIEDFDLIQEIVVMLNDARKEHELHFQSSLRLGEKLPSVRANRTHVQKALFNLLRNGIEAAMNGPGAPLPFITVTVSRGRDEDTAQVTVQDNGPGFAKGDAKRLFEPFFTTKSDGFGMGLSISRSLIEMNGGQLWADAKEGPGAIFHVTLPFAK